MRLLATSFITAMTLILAGQAFAVERKPCGPAEQEVMVSPPRTVLAVCNQLSASSRGGGGMRREAYVSVASHLAPRNGDS